MTPDGAAGVTGCKVTAPDFGALDIEGIEAAFGE